MDAPSTDGPRTIDLHMDDPSTDSPRVNDHCVVVTETADTLSHSLPKLDRPQSASAVVLAAMGGSSSEIEARGVHSGLQHCVPSGDLPPHPLQNLYRFPARLTLVSACAASACAASACEASACAVFDRHQDSLAG